MAFWSTSDIEPARQNRFIVRLGEADYTFLAKSVSKPTVETDVNEYRLLNQVVKFPSVPKWNDIAIKYVDSADKTIYEDLLKLMMPEQSIKNEWAANAIKKNDVELVVEQYDSTGDIVSTWLFKNPFIKSINFGENEYSSDNFVEIELNIAYDYAYLE